MKFDFLNDKKIRIVLTAVMVLLLLGLLLKACYVNVISQMPDQLTAQRYDDDHKDDTEFVQASIFFTEDQSISPESLKRLEYNMEKKMITVGIMEDPEAENNGPKIVDSFAPGKKDKNQEGADETAPEEEKIYRSCYSAQGISTLCFENKKSENVSTIGVGGDFFLFHPLELINGAYFSPDDLMRDRIVIDEALAWNLFGSSDIVGQCVTINDANHYVVGVVKKPEGKFYKAAGLSDNLVFMSYESLASYGTILSGKSEYVSTADNSLEGSDTMMPEKIGGINCYEVVMPSPVEGIAASILREASGLDDKYIYVTDNTTRFKELTIVTLIGGLGTRSMWTKPIFYPYWENVARGYEDILAYILFFRLLCIIALVLIITVVVINAYRNKKWTVRSVVNYLADKKYEFEARKAAEK